MEQIKCKYCNGTKEVAGMGHMTKKCTKCDIVEKVVQEKVEKIAKKKVSKVKKPKETKKNRSRK